jgi:hypothetical protein
VFVLACVDSGLVTGLADHPSKKSYQMSIRSIVLMGNMSEGLIGLVEEEEEEEEDNSLIYSA